MAFQKELRRPILTLLFLSIGGWLLHFRVHPISISPSHYVPFLYGLINIFIVPFLFSTKKTVIVAYAINGFGVIVGSILMTHMSLSSPPDAWTLPAIVFQTTLADIFLLFPKLFIGHTILLHYYPNGLGRLFTTAWWVKHFCYVTIVYSAGHFLLR